MICSALSLPAGQLSAERPDCQCHVIGSDVSGETQTQSKIRLTRSALAPGTTAAAANNAPKLSNCIGIPRCHATILPNTRAAWKAEFDSRQTYLAPCVLLTACLADK